MKLLLAFLLLIGGFGYYLMREVPKDVSGDEARIDRMWDEMSEKGRF